MSRLIKRHSITLAAFFYTSRGGQHTHTHTFTATDTEKAVCADWKNIGLSTFVSRQTFDGFQHPLTVTLYPCLCVRPRAARLFVRPSVRLPASRCMLGRRRLPLTINRSIDRPNKRATEEGSERTNESRRKKSDTKKPTQTRGESTRKKQSKFLSGGGGGARAWEKTGSKNCSLEEPQDFSDKHLEG